MPQKDFCNNIGAKRTFADTEVSSCITTQCASKGPLRIYRRALCHDGTARPHSSHIQPTTLSIAPAQVVGRQVVTQQRALRQDHLHKLRDNVDV